MLLENGAYVNAYGRPFSIALRVASYQGHREIVAILLKKGANVNVQGGPFGNAPQTASFSGQEKIVTMLLENGANVYLADHTAICCRQLQLKGKTRLWRCCFKRGPTPVPSGNFAMHTNTTDCTIIRCEQLLMKSKRRL